MSKDFSKYYTPENVAIELVKLLKLKPNKKVIDICCGSGNLLNAAKKEQPTLICQGVDIESNILVKTFPIENIDGRAYAINHVNQYDYALANPPFGQKTTKEYSDLLFKNVYSSINSQRLEIEMLVANLSLLKDNGVLLIILPTTVVKGRSALNIRKCLAKQHFVSAIIDLPLNAFFPEKIKCSALIIEKTSKSNIPTTLYKMDDNYKIEKMFKIDYSKMILGDWTKNESKKSTDFLIKQGSVSSHFFVESGEEILHTSKFSENWIPSTRYISIDKNKKYTMVQNGDILISRIGASAGQKCLYTGEPKYISDCLFVVKTHNNVISKRLLRLNLIPLVGGLSTPHITATSIYELYNNTYKTSDHNGI